jgi:hypothetical protein
MLYYLLRPFPDSLHNAYNGLNGFWGDGTGMRGHGGGEEQRRNLKDTLTKNALYICST